MLTHTRLLVAAALLAVPAAVSAHRMWLLPSGTVFSGTDGWVTVDSAVSNDLFYADHQPGRIEAVKVWQPDGSPGEIQNGATGRYRSVFDVKLDKPGTWKIGSAMSGVMGSFKVDGVEKRVGGRGGPPPVAGGARPAPLTVADIPANATDVKLTETSSRNEIFVTAGEPTRTVLQPTGKGLELDPVTHPDELVAGETARFRFLVDGKPAPGLKVTVVPGGKRYRDAEGARELTTGTDGVLAVEWPAAGMYWLNATVTDDKATAPRATQRRMSYTTTLEVMTP
ncbi:DUF4198 domain-containing protein [Sphingomonas rubra]|uniref:Uncharacterized conserved protein, contains GH25 family domain n=1 Tax=Sphingomonas rubra TaxID=634430 RepID=A0A1I5THC4_9SPHN|nr:DUF4198 domain-containing protein [Sphingomonas rubra]SFP82425.1 Uncharacterized conserved protein, contains GH25 family domain [Sphingomonas rubra]